MKKLSMIVGVLVLGSMTKSYGSQPYDIHKSLVAYIKETGHKPPMEEFETLSSLKLSFAYPDHNSIKSRFYSIQVLIAGLTDWYLELLKQPVSHQNQEKIKMLEFEIEKIHTMKIDLNSFVIGTTALITIYFELNKEPVSHENQEKINLLEFEIKKIYAIYLDSRQKIKDEHRLVNPLDQELDLLFFGFTPLITTYFTLKKESASKENQEKITLLEAKIKTIMNLLEAKIQTINAKSF